MKQVFYNLEAEIQEVWHGMEKNLSSIIKRRVAIQEAWRQYEGSCKQLVPKPKQNSFSSVQLSTTQVR
jgi:hypothetical protein